MPHSIIPPSSAEIWGKPGGCTGWPVMAQLHPEEEGDDEDARAGEASHEIGAALIHTAATSPTAAPSCEELIGKTALNGEIYTQEMYEGAAVYAHNVAQVMRERRIFGGPNLGIEAKVVAKRVHEHSWGTVDSFLFDKNNMDLFVWDYKFGHLIVEAFECWQLINYTAGLLERLGINGYDEQEITVHHRICQPRAHHRDGIIREWVGPATDLRAHISILNANAHEALGPDAVCRSGNHCRYCQARHGCEAGVTAGIGMFEALSRPLPLELSDPALGLLLTLVRRAQKQIDGLETMYSEQVKSRMRNKCDIPGWMHEPGKGKEVWAKPIAEIIALGDLLDKDLRKPPAVKTPKQAAALGIDDAVIAAYTELSKVAAQVVPDDGSKARRIFQ